MCCSPTFPPGFLRCVCVRDRERSGTIHQCPVGSSEQTDMAIFAVCQGSGAATELCPGDQVRTRRPGRLGHNLQNPIQARKGPCSFPSQQ